MKKLIVLLFSAVLCFPLIARPNHSSPRPMPRPAPVHHIHHTRPYQYHPHIHHTRPYQYHPHHRLDVPVAFGIGAVVGGLIAPTSVKIWVPGFWITEIDVYGRPFQRYVPGHWEFR